MNYRAIWISDVHLGTKHAQAERLLAFLRDNECRHLYIVGDLIDGWELARRWYWADDHNLLIQKLLRKNRKQTRITYITGNHDEFLEHFLGLGFGSIRLVRQAVHLTAKGRRYLVIHGHQFDGLVHFNRLLERVGSVLYQYLLDANLILNKARRRLGFGYWSMAGYLKAKTKSSVKFMTRYEQSMVRMARQHRVQGVICGHIHRPESKSMDGIEYLNCGDWVENCTALVEDQEGNIHLVKPYEGTLHGPGRGPRPSHPGTRRLGHLEPASTPACGGVGGCSWRSEPAGLL
ncbi:MAG TPA: UDP-2,3-diacylglucosamine diphosphatase [Methylomirabilota bacterium]|nr:UDP-2,3-diacylglucosamine diphosphatase [Methylomirabilota bacterium]